MSRKANLWDAERLARFANADDRQAIENFRLNNADFFSPTLWTEKDLLVPGDLFFGADVSGVLRAMGLEVPDAAARLGETDNATRVPAWWAVQQQLRRAWENGFPLDSCVILISLTHGETPFRVWPYQRAVMLLGMEPWRARFCGLCGKRFVADKPARRFCSNACAGKARKATRNTWWSDHGESWRQSRAKAQQRERAKG